jgi:hypothetical protein
LPEEDGDLWQVVRGKWGLLAGTLETLKEMISGCRDMSKQLVESTTDELDQLDFSISKLASQIGNRDYDMEPTSIFKSLKGAAESIYQLKINMATLKLRLDNVEDYVGEDATRRKEPTDAGKRWTLETFDPLIQWFSQHSSDKAKPGDKLTAQLDNLDMAVEDLLRATGVPKRTGSGQGGGVQWGLNQMGLNAGSAPALAAAVSSGVSEAAFKDLQDQVKSLEDQMEDKRFEIGSVVFKSERDTMAWLLVNAGQPGAHLHFIDAHSILNLGTTTVGGTDSTDILSF